MRGNPQVRIAQEQDGAALEPTAPREGPTATASGMPLRSADFTTLAEALDYAAQGDSGFNFYDGRGALTARLPYRELRARALELAKRLAPLGRGQRLALVADTHPDFAVMLYACQYAGLVAVPLPAAVHLGGREVYIRHLRKLMRDCEAVAAFAPPAFIGFLREATDGLPLTLSGTMDEFMALDAADELPPPPEAHELSYLQYTSGSTRFPRGTMITQAAVMANLKSIFNHGFQLGDDDRFCSWLPYYHDMGLVGIVLGCVATQRSVDYLPTRDFAMRPRLWLTLISRNRCTVSFSPPFGYTLVARRLRPGDAEALDLSAWRVAGVGAEMIHPESLERFAELLAPAGFKAQRVPALLRHGRVLARGQLRAPRARRLQRLDRHRRAVARGRGPSRRRARGRQGQGLHQLRRARCPATRSRSATRPAGPCPSGTAAGSSCAAPA